MDQSVGVIFVLLVRSTLNHQSFLGVSMWGSSPFPPLQWAKLPAEPGSKGSLAGNELTELANICLKWGGTWVRPPPRGPPRKPLLHVSVVGSLSASSERRACDDIR